MNRVQSVRTSAFTDRGMRALLAGTAALACAAAAWDVCGRVARVPGWWPVASYHAIAAGVALGCGAVLLGMLTTPRAQRASRRTALRLVALGVLLGAWLLRGHSEIPADPPLVGAELVAALVFALSLIRRR